MAIPWFMDYIKMTRIQAINKPAKDAKAKDAPPEGAVVKKAKKTSSARDRKFDRDVKKAQRTSHDHHQFNRTQFRRMVVQVMKESADGYRISAAALDPLMELVESQLHQTFKLSRCMSFELHGKRSINLKTFNLAEAALLRPHLFSACLKATSFNDAEHGIQCELATFEAKPKPKTKPATTDAA